jgi:hypothetical protein
MDCVPISIKHFPNSFRETDLPEQIKVESILVIVHSAEKKSPVEADKLQDKQEC